VAKGYPKSRKFTGTVNWVEIELGKADGGRERIDSLQLSQFTTH